MHYRDTKVLCVKNQDARDGLRTALATVVVMLLQKNACVSLDGLTQHALSQIAQEHQIVTEEVNVSHLAQRLVNHSVSAIMVGVVLHVNLNVLTVMCHQMEHVIAFHVIMGLLVIHFVQIIALFVQQMENVIVDLKDGEVITVNVKVAQVLERIAQIMVYAYQQGYVLVIQDGQVRFLLIFDRLMLIVYEIKPNSIFL